LANRGIGGVAAREINAENHQGGCGKRGMMAGKNRSQRHGSSMGSRTAASPL